MPDLTLLPRRAAVCAIDAEQTEFPPCPHWLHVEKVLTYNDDAAVAVANLPPGGMPHHTLSLAVYDFDQINQLPDGQAIQGFVVTVRAQARAANVAYVASLRLTRYELQSPELWADKGGPIKDDESGIDNWLTSQMSDMTFGTNTDRWKTERDIPDTTTLKDATKGFGNKFGVLIRFAEYTVQNEQVSLAWIKLTVHYA